jgi:hypothetical protein
MNTLSSLRCCPEEMSVSESSFDLRFAKQGHTYCLALGGISRDGIQNSNILSLRSPSFFFCFVSFFLKNRMLLLFVLVGLCFAAPRRTPFGVFDSSCVHVAKSGSHIFSRNGSVFVSHPTELIARAIPKCPARKARQFPASYDGWLAYTSFKTTFPT